MTTPQSTNNPLADLSDAGVSLWLDDLSRQRLQSGNLKDLIATEHIVGVTTNPSIFQAALKDGASYQKQIGELAARGADVDDTVREVTTDDVRDACDLFTATYDATGQSTAGCPSRSTRAWRTTPPRTIAQAQELAKIVDRPNVLIKIPATLAGLPAITAVHRRGDQRQRHADLLPGAVQGGHGRLPRPAWSRPRKAATTSPRSTPWPRSSSPGSTPRSTSGSTPSAPRRPRRCEGEAAIANARLAYQAYEQTFAGDRWDALAAAGANKQRPLWASTGVKDPKYDDTRYVVELVAPDTVNTAPEKTIDAVADHGVIRGNTIEGTYAQAVRRVLRARSARHRPRRRVRRPGDRGRRQVRDRPGTSCSNPSAGTRQEAEPARLTARSAPTVPRRQARPAEGHRRA